MIPGNTEDSRRRGHDQHPATTLPRNTGDIAGVAASSEEYSPSGNNRIASVDEAKNNRTTITRDPPPPSDKPQTLTRPPV